jgi:hypothetical protein
MHIPAELQEIAVLIDQERFISALIEMTHPPMAPVERRRIANIEMPHELREISPGGFHHQMKMVVHQHVTVNLDPVNLAGTLELV